MVSVRRLDSPAWRARKRAAKILFAHLKLDTPRNAFTTIAPATAALLVGWLFPADGAGKTMVGIVVWIVLQSILYFWILRTLPEEPPTVVGFSPLHTPEGRRIFREEQQRRIDQLTSQLARQPENRAEIEKELAKLKSGGLGFNPRDRRRYDANSL
ncbi:hypothetical protein [Bradyrhizobium elkanii]|uniref:hypothetical protein n=1 Tax=Bradyrhizobium elkanii TaxID=29448 RepID=UPI0004B192ED|nr:hypothetical protein [Bradyrhizobium elkanii]WLA78821.1 hypothetical protein QNJ99_25700 [Bradyrhizobium elkanii]